MNKVIVGIILLIVIVAGGFFVFREAPSDVPSTPGQNNGNGDGSPVYTPDGGISLVRTSNENNHMYRGVVSLPTPCHELNVMLAIAESYPEQVTIELTSFSTAEVCAQVISEKEFTAEFTASPKHSLRVLVNGEEVPHQVITENDLPKELPRDSVELVS